MRTEKYLPIPEAARKLGVSRGTVYNLIRRRDLEAIQIPPLGGDLRISTIELRRFIEWCRQDNTRDKMIQCPKCSWRF